MIGHETVTVLRPGTWGVDRNGNPLPGADIEIDVPGCLVSPRDSREPGEYGRTAVIVGLTVYMPPGTDIRTTDRVRVRGVVRDVEGEPGDWRSPYIGAQGIEVALRGVSG